MGLLMNLAVMLAAINAILLIILFVIYFQNYVKMRAKVSLGLSIFALAFIIQKVFSAYVFLNMMTEHAELDLPIFILEILQSFAFAVLLWITFE